MRYLSLYIEFVKIKLMSIAEYRASFISGAVARFLSYGVEVALLWGDD